MSFRQRELLSKLSRAERAAYNSYAWEHSSTCLPDTRLDIRKQIMAWSENVSTTTPCIYWLSGVAGTGKSTISRTIAHSLDDLDQLGASFFFSRGQGDISNARKFVATIAYQLTLSLPELVPEICKAVADNSDISVRGLREQWKHLVLQPLRNICPASTRRRPLVLVIDALDECEGDDDVKLMIHLLSQAKTLSGISLRIFITSRPETPIRLGFAEVVRTEKNSVRGFILHNIEKSIIEHDIKIFLKIKLGKVCFGHGSPDPNLQLPQGWPGDDNIELLCQMTRGLFIYAATACRFIADPLWDPDQRLAMILKHSYVGQSRSEALDGIYSTVLHQSVKPIAAEDRRVFFSEFRHVVGSIVVLLETLSIRVIASLLNVPARSISTRLSTLHSVLEVPEDDHQDTPIKLLHLSFRDFLLDPARCTDQRLAVEERATHYGLFLCCLRVMQQQLKQDICNLVDPGTEIGSITPSVIQSFISPELQYSSRYWIQHLDASAKPVPNEVYDFMKKHFLYWLEVLSLLGNMHGGVLEITKLESMIVVGIP